MIKLSKMMVIGSVLLLAMVFSTGVFAEETATININKATVEELSTLKNIGAKYAQKIVEYREKNGPFQKVEDILLVKGIGTKTLEANKDKITLN